MACAVLPARANDARTVDEAVRDALANPALAASLAAGLQTVDAEIDAATVYEPASLGLEHEQVLFPDALAGRETALVFEQPFDPIDWRARLRATRPQRQALVRAQHEVDRLAIATAVRKAFYEVIYLDLRLEVLDRWIEGLDRAVALTELREARGDASGYAVRRVRREQATARAERAVEAARRGEAWGRLSVHTQWQSPTRLVGGLIPIPGEEPPPESAEASAIERTRGLFIAESEAYVDPVWRGWAFGAGYRNIGAADAMGHGVMVSLSVPITLWNTDRSRVAELNAWRARIEADEIRFGRRLGRAVDAARSRLTAAMTAVDALPGGEAETDFTTVADNAFRAGETTLEGLLDAHDTEARLHLAALDLQWEARRAAIALDHHLGAGVIP